MWSNVYQGLQSYLELKVVEPRLLSLKLAPPKTDIEPEPMSYNEETDAVNKLNTGGWSFLESLGKANDSTESDNVYVHPLVKRSALTLSEKSLEMCTENLGSETGSEASESIDELTLNSGAYNYSPSRPKESSSRRKTSRVESFPPPLTSISGSNGVKVKSHREDGRLVLQAVSIPPCNRYFIADRSEGRVRLSIFKDASIDVNEEEDRDRDEVVENDGENGDEVVEEIKEESVMREVRIWKEIVGMLGVKLRHGKWVAQADAKKVGALCTKACLLGSHCCWRDYLKPTSWKICLNPRRNYYYYYYYWIPY